MDDFDPLVSRSHPTSDPSQGSRNGDGVMAGGAGHREIPDGGHSTGYEHGRDHGQDHGRTGEHLRGLEASMTTDGVGPGPVAAGPGADAIADSGAAGPEAPFLTGQDDQGAAQTQPRNQPQPEPQPEPQPKPTGELTAEGDALADISLSILASLQRRLQPEQWKTWFRRVRVVRIDDRSVSFAVPNEFVRDWIAKYYLEQMGAAVTASLGVKRMVVLHVDPEHAVGLTGNPAQLLADEELASDPARPAVEPGPSRNDPVGGTRPPAAPTPAPTRTPREGRPGATDSRHTGRQDPAAGKSFAEPVDTASAASSLTEPPRPAGLLRNSDIVLNPRYTFDNFVVGPCNRFGHAAAVGAAEQLGTSYNPLFLHGHVGVGKTHLLQGLCYMVLDREPDKRILYLSCETFLNHFINALENGDLMEFRERYRNVDVLVVDDIQLLANKEKTQEEFFHTFNALYNAGGQIVLSSDSPPKDIPGLQDRLVSRFKWGLVTEVPAPCFETRVAIVKRKSRSQGRELPDEVAQYIAENVDENVRELEGAVTRLLGYAGITHKQIDIPLAQEALAGILQVKRTAPTMDDIIALVTDHYSVKLADLQSKRRTNAIAFPRQVAMYLARKITRHSLEEIGGFFGGRDHTTVLYAVDKIGKVIKKDEDVAKTIANMLDRLGGPRRD